MKGRLTHFGFGIAALAACAVSGADSSTRIDRGTSGNAEAAVAARDEVQHKPEAPITVQLRARESEPGIYDVVLEATPRADVNAVTVTWIPPAAVRLRQPAQSSFGPTLAGQTRTARVTAELSGDGADLLASVGVDAGRGVAPRKLVAHTLGLPPPPPTRPRRLVTLPSGEIIEEVVR